MNKFTTLAFTASTLALLALAGCNKPGAATAETPAADAAPAATADMASPAPAADAAAPVADAASADAAAPAGDEAAVDQSIDNVLGDHATYRRVIADFQKAVAGHDAAAVASLLHYPIGVDIAGKNAVIKDAAEFTRDYDKFMTPQIAKAIIDTRYADVMVNDKGVMLGQGQAWVNGICKDSACKDVDVKVVTLQSGPN